MDLLKIHTRFSEFIFNLITYVLFYGILILSTRVLVASLLPPSAPFADFESTIIATRKPDIIEVTLVRTAQILKTVNLAVYRSVTHIPTKQNYELPGQYLILKDGDEVSFTKTYLLPSSAPDGRYEFNTLVVWRPMFSLIDWNTTVPSPSFIVCGKTVPCEKS